MYRAIPALILTVFVAGPASAAGLLIPEERTCRRWRCSITVTITIDDQVAITTSSRRSATTPTGNSKRPTSSRFPRGRASTSSPCGSTARKPRASWSKPRRPARSTPTSSAARKDPGLLEYMGNNLLRMKVFPILPHKRSESDAQLHRRRRARKATWSSTSIRSRPTARRRDARRVLDHGDHQVAACRCRMSTARRMRSP